MSLPIWRSSIPTGTIGAVSELNVSMDLMKKGHSVFRAMSPSCPFDLVAFKDGGMQRIEVRTGFRNPKSGRINFNRKGDYDLIAVVLEGEEIIYMTKNDFPPKEEKRKWLRR